MDPRFTAALEEEKMLFMFCSKFPNNHALSPNLYVTRADESEIRVCRLQIRSYAFAPFPAVTGVRLMADKPEIA